MTGRRGTRVQSGSFLQYHLSSLTLTGKFPEHETALLENSSNRQVLGRDTGRLGFGERVDTFCSPRIWHHAGRPTAGHSAETTRKNSKHNGRRTIACYPLNNRRSKPEYFMVMKTKSKIHDTFRISEVPKESYYRDSKLKNTKEKLNILHDPYMIENNLNHTME